MSKRVEYDKKTEKFKIEDISFLMKSLRIKIYLIKKYIDEDWEIALLVYPELEKIKKLSNYSYKLSLQFQFYLLKPKNSTSLKKFQINL